METIQCIFCDTWSDNVVIEENGYQGRKCLQCDLIYTSPRPSFSEIVNIYTEDKVHTYAESIIPDEFFKRLIAKNTLGLLKRHIRSGLMLEIGAGGGFFLDEARKDGFEVFAIELNNIQANFINKTLGIPCESSPLDESSFDGKYFDVIYHCNVLSHLYDPIAEFKKIYKRLRSNGILIFETGNLGDVEKKYYKTITEFGYPDHLFFFSEKSIKYLIKETGFEYLETHRFSKTLFFFKNKILNIVKNSIGNSNVRKNLGKNGKGSDFTKINRNINLKVLIQRAKRYISYFLIYKIGQLMPKKGRPQTVIVVARKND